MWIAVLVKIYICVTVCIYTYKHTYVDICMDSTYMHTEDQQSFLFRFFFHMYFFFFLIAEYNRCLRLKYNFCFLTFNVYLNACYETRPLVSLDIIAENQSLTLV